MTSKAIEIARLQFITVDHPAISHADQAIRAIVAGCKWVQLRMKEVSTGQMIAEAQKIVPVANAHGAILLINDHPAVAMQSGAHGVHLGKEDICPILARQALGEKFLIGGTANTLEDIHSLIAKGVDYIGLGPFRFTTTKKRLSPTLGLEGYTQIMTELRKYSNAVPIVAIGGIVESDVQPLRQTGIHGIALAGAIVAREEIETNIHNFQQLIHS